MTAQADPERGLEHDAERRVAELQLALPDSIPPVGSYVRAVRTGDLLFISGHLPDSAGAPLHSGKLGRDISTEQGYEAARQAAVNLLGTVRQQVGDLNRVHRVVKLLGMVNSTEDFIEQPRVVDGASDLLREVFGDAAMHARSAVGMAQLPRNNCVEIEAVIEVRERPGPDGPGGGDIAREPMRPGEAAGSA